MPPLIPRRINFFFLFFNEETLFVTFLEEKEIRRNSFGLTEESANDPLKFGIFRALDDSQSSHAHFPLEVGALV